MKETTLYLEDGISIKVFGVRFVDRGWKHTNLYTMFTRDVAILDMMQGFPNDLRVWFKWNSKWRLGGVRDLLTKAECDEDGKRIGDVYDLAVDVYKKPIPPNDVPLRVHVAVNVK